VVVVALAFVLFAVVRGVAGPAWGAAAVALAAAIVVLILAFVLTRRAHPKPARGDDQNLTGRLVELARERPLVAAGAIAAAVAVIVRNPRILTAVAAAAFAGRGARAKR
jgi:uncharacterized membrane protein